MKKLKDYSEDIYKCTKCGLCQAVCPIFQETGLETSVSRGKFTLLNGIVNGHIKFNKNIGKYLEMCLGCRACFEFCPSGINAEEIINAARAEYAERYGVNIIKKIILVILKHCRRILPASLIRSFTSHLFTVNSVHSTVQDDKRAKIIYFPGCFDTSTKAVKMVLEKNGFDVHIPKGFSCCGMAAKSAGDMNTFTKLMQNNISKIPADIDFIITECASCGSAWQEYPKHIAKKVVNIYKFLNDIDLYIPKNASYNKTVTWHDPCHLVRFQQIAQEPRNILREIPGLTFVEMEEADKCCGAAGTFCVTKPLISLPISRKKALNIINTGADAVATSCSGCKIGITQGLLSLKTIKPIVSPVQILAEIYSQE
ncbi:MAG: hypothetical protein A2Y25_04465 [Candidatus Melainabacteria bacterium GWF2_37_15]|nr:MAG: hypothetical protein A2Y25_04465 [Candidatus Melainabacteria bacterium GWF2_37_15]